MAFSFGARPTRRADSNIAKKSKAPAKKVAPTVKSGSDIAARIAQAKLDVETNLGKYRDEYIVIQDKEVLHDYITECIGNGYISIDTETDGLNPYADRIAGICPYTYGQKGAYLPINHVSYITGEKVPDQLEQDFIIEEFKRLLKKKPDIDMFHANFDIRVLRQFGLDDIYCTWDGLIAAKLLNENEPTHALKPLHNRYCLDGKGDAFKFDDLFRGIPFTKVPIKVGYLYAAHDPVITTELCDFQRPFLGRSPEEAREDLQSVSWVFHNIEMPIVKVVCDMEDSGIALDLDYADKLSKKYHELEEKQTSVFYESLKPYEAKIDAYRKKHPDVTLDDPISIGSPSQLAILLYDILKLPPVDKRKPRGTGEEILSKIDNPICKAVLDYRGTGKLLSTYIDKLPTCLGKDGRIHCNFNQYGARTGRFSSNEPNLQNIPSHNKDVRKMFVASPGCVLMSSDFSQQEPKCLAALCRQQGDSQMYDTFMQGKDLYAEIASKAFKKTYEECLEHFPKGSFIKEVDGKWFYATEDDYDKVADGEKDVYADGKERRTRAKSILLGVLYGRGENSIAEQLRCTEDEAKAIKSSVFRGFPAIKQFEDDSKDFAFENGYVTTVCGRKRRLPDLWLDEFEFSYKDGYRDDDLLDFDSGEEESCEVPDKVQKRYLRKLDGCWGREKQTIIQEARDEGIVIRDNGMKIADAERQIVNSRIQGSAADLTKLAMIHLNNDPRLKELGFKLLIPIHDEVICECPKENMKECSELLAQTMSKAAEEILEMPIRCDVEVTERWYGEEVQID